MAACAAIMFKCSGVNPPGEPSTDCPAGRYVYVGLPMSTTLGFGGIGVEDVAEQTGGMLTLFPVIPGDGNLGEQVQHYDPACPYCALATMDANLASEEWLAEMTETNPEGLANYRASRQRYVQLVFHLESGRDEPIPGQHDEETS